MFTSNTDQLCLSVSHTSISLTMVAASFVMNIFPKWVTTILLRPEEISVRITRALYLRKNFELCLLVHKKCWRSGSTPGKLRYFWPQSHPFQNKTALHLITSGQSQERSGRALPFWTEIQIVTVKVTTEKSGKSMIEGTTKRFNSSRILSASLLLSASLILSDQWSSDNA